MNPYLEKLRNLTFTIEPNESDNIKIKNIIKELKSISKSNKSSFEIRLQQKYPEIYSKYIMNKQEFLDKIACVFRFNINRRIDGILKLSDIREKRLDIILNRKPFSKDELIQYCYFGIGQMGYNSDIYPMIQSYIIRHLFGNNINVVEIVDFLKNSLYYDSHYHCVDFK